MTNLKNECGKDKPEITKNKLKTDKSLGLSLQNKQEIDNNKWLSGNHIRTAHYLLKQQFANFGGMEDTIKCPIFNKRTNSWNVPENVFKKLMKGPSLQILYNGHHHWLLTVKTEDNAPLYTWTA